MKQSFFCLIMLLSGCISSQSSAASHESPNANHFTILYTGSAYGEIKPCGCSKEGDLGGLSRRAAYIEQVRKENKDVILVDTGDNFKEASDQGILKAQTMLKGMKMMGYDIIAPGEKDFIYGVKIFNGNSIGLWGAGNLNFSGSERLAFSPYIIKELSWGYKVAIIPLLDQALFYSIRHSGIEIYDYAKTLENILEDIKKEDIDFIILLTHSPVEMAKELLKKEGINIIINGHIDNLTPEDEIIALKNKILAHPKERGQQIGRIDVFIENKRVHIENSFIPLTSRFKDHPMLAALYDEYNKKVEKLFFESLKRKKAGYSAKNYVSEKPCKECHPGEHRIWEKTRHASAFKTTLMRINKHHDPECIVCHTAGFGKEGGFISETATERLANVQCENCHGPGENHIKNVNDDYGVNAKDVCIKCHNKSHSPAFNFSKYWEKIKH